MIGQNDEHLLGPLPVVLMQNSDPITQMDHQPIIIFITIHNFWMH